MARISKDDTIIKNNPNMTVHEYRLLGVSENKLKELQAREESDLKATKQKIDPKVVDETTKAMPVTAKAEPKVTLTPTISAQPILRPIHQYGDDDMAILVEKASGKRTPMRRHYANKFVRKNQKTHHVEG